MLENKYSTSTKLLVPRNGTNVKESKKVEKEETSCII